MFIRLDILFVVSMIFVDVEENFKFVKFIIDFIIEWYGVKKYLYSLMIFG